MLHSLYNKVLSLLGKNTGEEGGAAEINAGAHSLIPGSVDWASPSMLMPFDESLLERARTLWQFGDWEGLAKLDKERIQHHPDRAKLALLAASGSLQVGSVSTARQFIRLAEEWGCSKKVISQVLVSGVHNTLGRVAAVSGDMATAKFQFEKAISIGGFGSEIQLIAKGRTRLQCENLGLVEGVSGRLSSVKDVMLARTKSSLSGHNVTPWNSTKNVTYSDEAYEYYCQLSASVSRGEVVPFILLDSKSLPRSGLHYLKNTLEKVMGNCFSFCEWYQEVGCCKMMPCANTGHACYAIDKSVLRLRLLKSHDFALTDPIYAAGGVIKRLVLIREPIFQLTSWFAIEELARHKDILSEAGIKMEKIWLSHEPEIISQAFAVMDKNYLPLQSSFVEDWLQIKSEYIEGFMRKWIPPAGEYDPAVTQVVDYDSINDYIATLLHNLRAAAPEQVQKRIDEFPDTGVNEFVKRTSPFEVESKNLTDFLEVHAELFLEHAHRIKAVRRELFVV